jgi:hypothetical protein
MNTIFPKDECISTSSRVNAASNKNINALLYRSKIS